MREARVRSQAQKTPSCITPLPSAAPLCGGGSRRARKMDGRRSRAKSARGAKPGQATLRSLRSFSSRPVGNPPWAVGTCLPGRVHYTTPGGVVYAERAGKMCVSCKGRAEVSRGFWRAVKGGAVQRGEGCLAGRKRARAEGSKAVKGRAARQEGSGGLGPRSACLMPREGEVRSAGFGASPALAA